MNLVMLLGRITKDIELRYTQTNIACAEFDIAVNNGKDKDGNNRPADFIRCVLWDKQAENLSKYCKKGSMIAINGSIKVDKYQDDNGNNRYKTYVLCRKTTFLDSNNSNYHLPEEPDYLKGKTSITADEIDNIPDNELPF